MPSAPTRTASRLRPVLLAALLAALALVVVFLPRAGDPRADDDPAAPAPPDSPEDDPEDDPDDAIAWTATVDADAVARARRAVDALLDEPQVRIEGESDLYGTVETFDIEVDRASRTFSSTETVGSDLGIDATIQKMEAPTHQFIRVVNDLDSGAEGTWNVIPIEVPEQLEFDAAYTLFGRITPDLPQLVEVWSQLELDVRVATDGDREGLRLVARADDLTRFLRDNAVVSVGPSDEIGSSIWQLWFEGEDLVRLEGRGVQFFDGEPFRGARIDIDYERVPVRIALPPVPD